jgi:4-carboxymuconolactone decarboxylase
MRPFRTFLGLLLVLGTGATMGYALSRVSPQSGSSSRSSTAFSATFPKDVSPETGNRLPPVNREELDETGKKLYDAGGPAAAFGPGRIRLYSPPVAALMHAENDYLRNKSGLEKRLTELIILVTAREMDAQFEWTTHEPLARKAGLQQEIIDVVKYRKPLNGIGEKEACVIQLGREAFGKHKVSSETFARALKQFGDRGLVNVVALMGDYASTAILLAAFDQHVHQTDTPLLPIP